MIINGIELTIKSRVTFTTTNQFDTQSYVGTIVALGDYDITSVCHNDVDNYHLQILKGNSINPDPKNHEYFILRFPDNTLMAVAKDWVSAATFAVLDESVDFHIVVRSVSSPSVKAEILNILDAAGYQASEYTP